MKNIPTTTTESLEKQNKSLLKKYKGEKPVMKLRQYETTIRKNAVDEVIKGDWSPMEFTMKDARKLISELEERNKHLEYRNREFDELKKQLDQANYSCSLLQKELKELRARTKEATKEQKLRAAEALAGHSDWERDENGVWKEVQQTKKPRGKKK